MSALADSALPDIVVEPRGRLRLTPVDIGDLLTRKLPPREHLVTPFLPAQGLALLYAQRGIGKTYLALTIAYSLAAGVDMLKGRWKVPRPRSVLYLDGEMPAVAMQERLAALVQSIGVEPKAAFKLVTPDLLPRDQPPLNLSSPAHQDALEPHLEGVDLVVVDNLSTLTSGAENEADAWLPVQHWALRQRAAGRSVLLIHHAGKGGAQRGTSRREDVLDTVISLRRPPDYNPSAGAAFELRFEKARGFHGDDAAGFEAALTEDEHGRQVWTVEDAETCTFNRVVDLHNEGLSQKEIVLELGINKSGVSRHVRRARQEGLLRERD